MSLAQRLKTTRKKQGLSQAELAAQVDVSQPTIANWERGGHIPRPDGLARIADALGTDPAWLLSGEMPARNNPAHQHLAKPIMQIPICEWPLDRRDPTASQPIDYIAMATDRPDLFALNAPVSEGYLSGTVLVFSRSDVAVPGSFLTPTSSGFALVDATSLHNNVFARLIYSIVPH